MKRRKGFYSISVVAKMFEVHQQTIRLYEKEGLITPKRSSGNTRLFSEEDVDRLEEIIYLTHKLGVNLAGVEMVLKLQKKIKKLQEDMNKVFDQTQEQFTEDTTLFKESIRHQTSRLLNLKQPSTALLPTSVKIDDEEEIASKAASTKKSKPAPPKSPALKKSGMSDRTAQQSIGQEPPADWEIDYSEE
jgi:MerR family transcriptional regulator, heat shock protein HspR